MFEPVREPKSCFAPFELDCPELEPGAPALLAAGLPVGVSVPQVRLDRALFGQAGPLAPLAVGNVLESGGHAVLRLLRRCFLPSADGGHAVPVVWATALRKISGKIPAIPIKSGYSLAWVTLSDKGFAGQRQDMSGPLIKALLLRSLPLDFDQGFLLPDNPEQLRPLALDLALVQGFDLIVCSGGTGLAERDLTPEALLPILDRRLAGFEQAMLAASLAKTPHAAISRALAGTIGRSLILALPGSKKGSTENLEAVIPALGHALAKLQGDPADCGS